MLTISKKRETAKVAALLALFGLLCFFFIYQSKGMDKLKTESGTFHINQ
jgi:hypothetical protein